ncbi:sulfotransferase family protein [Maricaulaceae bacterium EIL42A08]|nr:sulfotransferase family protein [Maricaulaceae bacterium EIL42A08]
MIMGFEHRFLLFHVPKTGGTSLKRVLQNFSGAPAHGVILDDYTVLEKAGENAVVKSWHRPDERPEGFEQTIIAQPDAMANSVEPREAGRLRKHTNVAQARAFFRDSFYQSFRRVAVFRNPYARTYSAYRFKVKEALKHGRDVARMLQDDEPITFAEYIDSGLCNQVLASKPQSSWYEDHEGFNALKLESLSADLSAFFRQLGLSEQTNAELVEAAVTTRVNISAEKDAWRSLHSEDRARIEKAYISDFETLNY